jgi:hypothetical protein
VEDGFGLVVGVMTQGDDVRSERPSGLLEEGVSQASAGLLDGLTGRACGLGHVNRSREAGQPDPPDGFLDECHVRRRVGPQSVVEVGDVQTPAASAVTIDDVQAVQQGHRVRPAGDGDDDGRSLRDQLPSGVEEAFLEESMVHEIHEMPREHEAEPASVKPVIPMKPAQPTPTARLLFPKSF